MRRNLYNLIMHHDPEFWSGDKEYIDFSRSRFLEYTEKDIKSQFQSLDQSAIDKLKKMPTLFAVEQESADTKIGKITSIEILPKSLRIFYKFDGRYNPLSKGALESLNIGDKEIYRTHWAIKEANIDDFYAQRSKTVEGILDEVKKSLDRTLQNTDLTKAVILYAFNASGKTRLSKLFVDQYDEQVLCYNAFIEDLFSWDNENYILSFDSNSWIAKLIEKHGLQNQIIDDFQMFSGSKLQPTFKLSKTKETSKEKDLPKVETSFRIYSGDENPTNIKISKGEESVFKWSIFYTILSLAIETLNEDLEEREEPDFNGYKYIVIDDPVSSIDDARIIKIALQLKELISKSKNQLSFLVTTHHALFFNILFNAFKNDPLIAQKGYMLSKTNKGLHLTEQKADSPFAYHHVVVSEIGRAIASNDIQKHHFNLFRTLLEKTANFLGHRRWEEMLAGDTYGKVIKKILHHYSHGSLSELEHKDLSAQDKDDFVAAYSSFIKDFKWGAAAHD
jgi:hypothetical protein